MKRSQRAERGCREALEGRWWSVVKPSCRVVRAAGVSKGVDLKPNRSTGRERAVVGVVTQDGESASV